MTPQNSSHFAIREWSIGDRPREKMLQNGAQQLTNAELLAILNRKRTTRCLGS